MAEKLSLELELLDKVGGPAKKAAAALRAIEQQQKKTQETVNKFANAWERIGAKAAKDKEKQAGIAVRAHEKEMAAVRKLGLAQLEAARMNEKFDKARQKAIEAAKKHSFFGALGSKLPFRSVADYAKGAFWGHLAAEGVAKIAEGFLEGAHMAVEFIADGIKDAFKAIGKEQERISGYDLTLGKEGSEVAREDIERFSKKTAFSASQNMDMMLPLFRAGLKGQDARTMYAAALDLAAGRGKGSDQGAVNEAVELFAKIQQKGGITSKQLAGIGLGETNLPAFYKDLGKYLHISAKEAEKKAGEGGIDPQILRNSIVMAIERQQGGEAGTGAERAGKSLFGMWNKLKELPEDFFEKMVNSPAIPRLSKALGGVLEQLNPDSPTGRRIFGTLERMFERVAGWMTEAIQPENIDSLINAFKGAWDFASRLFGVVQSVWNLSRDIVKLLGDLGVGKLLTAALKSIEFLVVRLEKLIGLVDKATEALTGRTNRDAIDSYNEKAKQLREEHPEQFGANGQYLGNAYINGHVIQRRRGEMKTGSDIKVGDINVEIYPSKDDTNHTGQQVAQSIKKHVVNAMARAAVEGG